MSRSQALPVVGEDAATGGNDRALHLDGATNFRDLGGYRTRDGRTVRWRTLFRSDHLARLSSTDMQQLQALGVARALDFRGDAESARAPYRLPGVTRRALSIEPTVVQGMRQLLDAGESLTAACMSELMEQTYRYFARDCTVQYRAMFAELLADDAPLVVHCTAGKDRTGFGAAMILFALGVPRATVVRDYLLTNDLYRMPDTGSTVLPPDALQVLWRVQRSFLDAALQVLQDDFGGVDAYLEAQLGLADAEREYLASVYLTSTDDADSARR